MTFNGAGTFVQKARLSRAGLWGYNETTFLEHDPDAESEVARIDQTAGQRRVRDRRKIVQNNRSVIAERGV